MKKLTLFLLAAAAIMLASCYSDDSVATTAAKTQNQMNFYATVIQTPVSRAADSAVKVDTLNEVEVNYSVLDAHTNYQDSVITAKLSAHVRTAHDVTVTIPVPEDFRSVLCQVDDFDIRINDQFIYNVGHATTVTDEVTGITVTYAYDAAQQAVVVTTSGIADNYAKCTPAQSMQDPTDPTHATYNVIAHEFTFEVYVRYWAEYNDANLAKVTESANKTTVALDEDGTDVAFRNTIVKAGTEILSHEISTAGDTTSVTTTKKYDDFTVTATNFPAAK